MSVSEPLSQEPAPASPPPEGPGPTTQLPCAPMTEPPPEEPRANPILTTPWKSTSAPPVDASPIPSAVLERLASVGYELIKELAHGGMGVVYKARQTRLKRLVALKMIRTGIYAASVELKRFQDEAEAIARLQHPNIVQIYEVGELDGMPFLSLEYLEGGTLADRLRRGPLPPMRAAELLEPVARAVHAAHERKVIHRDLKPANILQAADGTPKITDFGLAKFTDTEHAKGHTPSDSIIGTPNYMAPEQARGKSRLLGPPVDIWALGIILYEALAGRVPFRGDTPVDTLMAVVQQQPEPFAATEKVPRDLEAICLQCLQKDPAKRYASALELADDLRRFLEGKPVLARRESTGSRRRWGVLVAAVPILVGGILLVRPLFDRAAPEGSSALLEAPRDDVTLLPPVPTTPAKAEPPRVEKPKVEPAKVEPPPDPARVLLAEAEGHARQGRYDAFFPAFAALEKHDGDPAARTALLARVAQAASEDLQLTPERLETVLAGVGATKVWQTAGAVGKLGEAYAALAGRLVGERYAVLEKPEDFARLLPFCDAAEGTGRADSLTRWCRADCLMLAGKGVAPLSEKERETVRKLLAELPGERNAQVRKYAVFVAGLAAAHGGDLTEAAARLEEGFEGTPPAKFTQSPLRNRLAAEALARAGSGVMDPAERYRRYERARERYGKDVPAALLVKLAVAAGEAEKAEFDRLLGEANRVQPLAEWSAADQAALAGAFLRWAGKHRVAAVGLLDLVGPVLERRTADRPDDGAAYLWLAKANGRRWLGGEKASKAEREKVVGQLARALESRAKEMAQAKAVGGWRALMGLFNEDVVTLFRGMDETSLRYAVLVRMLPPERDKQTESHHVDLLLARLRLIRDHAELRRLDGKEERPLFLGDERRLTEKLLSTNADKAAVLEDTMNVCVALSDDKSLTQQDRDTFWKAGTDRLERLGTLLLEDSTYEHFTKGPELARSCATYFRNKARTASEADKEKLQRQAEQLEKMAEKREKNKTGPAAGAMP